MENEVIFDENPIVNSIEPQDVPTDATLAPTDDILPTSTTCCDSVPVPPTCPECGGVSVAQFFGTIQESVTIVWKFHLKTRKYSTHKALNDFYNDALDIVDDIIEQYQGINGIVEDPFVNTIFVDGKNEVSYLNELKSFVETNKCVLGDRSEINSTIDSFLVLIDSTLGFLNNYNESIVKSYDEFCYENLNERCSYDRFGERSCDDPDKSDYDPEENTECCEEE